MWRVNETGTQLPAAPRGRTELAGTVVAKSPQLTEELGAKGFAEEGKIGWVVQ